MKKMMALLVCVFSFNAFAQLLLPTKTENGFVNVNNKQEYDYSVYPNEKIWYHFGRPYWRAADQSKPVATTAKPAKKAKAANPFAKSQTANITLDVKFELGKTTIDREYTSAIDELGRFLQENKNIAIEIQGHTDNTGALEFNRHLSQQRAQSVKSYIVEKYGIAGERLRAVGVGPDRPVASNDTADGRKQNRRVEVQIIR